MNSEKVLKKQARDFYKYGPVYEVSFKGGKRRVRRVSETERKLRAKGAL